MAVLMSSSQMKEYFARKKFSKKVESIKLTPRNGKQMSQDLMSLQTVSKTHSCTNNASAKVDRKNKINVRMVDLNKIMSTSTIPKEIDLGPMSPPKRTLTDSVGIHSSESSSLSKRDYLSASERSESGYVIKASVSAASCEEKLVRKGIGEDVKDSGENADNLYEIQSRKSSSLPTFSGAPYNSVLETPCNQFSRPPGHSKVTFSNVVSTRIQTPSPAVLDSGVFSKPFMRAKSSDSAMIRSVHKPFWEQSSPLLMKAEEAPKHSPAKIDMWKTLQKQREDHKTEKAVGRNSRHFGEYSRPLSENSFCKEFNRKRDLAYLHEDFQATPLKKYITKEEYQLRKQKEKQKKQLKKEKERISKEKKQMHKVEELKKQNSLWSILDDSFYNKMEPCGNKNVNETACEDKPHSTGTSLLLDKRFECYVDDAKYNKVFTKCSDVAQGHEARKETREQNKGFVLSKGKSYGDDGNLEHKPFWEIVDDAYYNKTTHHRQKVDLENQTEAKKYKVGAPRAENASELEDIAGGRAVERLSEISETAQTPSNFKIPDLMMNPPDSQTARSLNWLAFISGKKPSDTDVSKTPSRKNFAPNSHINDLKIPLQRQSTNDCDKKTEEIRSPNTRTTRTPATQITQLLEDAHVSNGIHQHGVNPETHDRVTYQDLGDKMAEEEKVEFENTTVVKDLLLELLDNVCKKTEKLVQNELHCPAIQKSTGEIHTVERVEVDTNTDTLHTFDVETQTEEAIALARTNETNKKTKSVSSECHILKNFPVTMNRFTQTNVEELTKVQSSSTQTQLCGTSVEMPEIYDDKDLNYVVPRNKKYPEETTEVQRPSEDRKLPQSPTLPVNCNISEEAASNLTAEMLNTSKNKDGLLIDHVAARNHVVKDASKGVKSVELIHACQHKSESNEHFDKVHSNKMNDDQENILPQSKSDFTEMKSLHDWVKLIIVEDLFARLSGKSNSISRVDVSIISKRTGHMESQLAKHSRDTDTLEFPTEISDKREQLIQSIGTKEKTSADQSDLKSLQIKPSSNVLSRKIDNNVSNKEIKDTRATSTVSILRNQPEDSRFNSEEEYATTKTNSIGSLCSVNEKSNVPVEHKMKDFKGSEYLMLTNQTKIQSPRNEKISDELESVLNVTESVNKHMNSAGSKYQNTRDEVVKDQTGLPKQSLSRSPPDYSSIHGTQLSELLFSQSSDDDHAKISQNHQVTMQTTNTDRTAVRYNLRSKSKP